MHLSLLAAWPLSPDPLYERRPACPSLLMRTFGGRSSASYALQVRRINELEPGLIPAGLAVLAFVVLGVKDAGYPATVWYPIAIFLAALLAVAAWGGRGTFGSLSRFAIASVVFLALLTLWTYVTIGWSDVKGDALDGANRGLLYLIVYVLFLLAAP